MERGDWEQMLEDIETAEKHLKETLDPIQTKCAVQKLLIKDTKNHIEASLGRVKKLGQGSPDALFAACFDELSEAEKRHFALQNMLEAVKHSGRPLSEIVRQFHTAGETNVEVPPTVPPGSKDDPKPSWLLHKLMDTLKGLAKTLIQAAVSVTKDVFGDLVKAIQPIVGMAGWWPTISWKVDLEQLNYSAVQDIFGKIRPSEQQAPASS